MSGYHTIVEADDNADDGKAGEVMQILCEAYPGHPWHVRISGGMIIIKHTRLSNKWAFARRYDRVTFDAGVLKRAITMAAGEFLERAELARGRAVDGATVRLVDGIPQKDVLPAVLATQ